MADPFSGAFKFAKNAMNNVMAGGAVHTPPVTGKFTTEEFEESLRDLTQGKQSNTDRKRALQAKIQTHTLKNLQKTSNEHFLPGQFKTGFRQVQVVETDSAIAPAGWERKDDVNDFAKTIYEDNLKFMNVAAENMPANCDILTLDNVMDDKPPCGDKPWDPQVPLHGTDSGGSPVVVLYAGHPGLLDFSKLMDKSHNEATDCGNGNDAGARAAWMSALMQMSATQLRERMKAMNCDPKAVDRVCDFISSCEDEPANRSARIAHFVAQGPKAAYPDGMHKDEKLGNDLQKLTDHLLAPLRGKPLSSPNNGSGNAKMLFMLNRLGVRGAILGKKHDGLNGALNRSFFYSSGEAHKVVTDISAAKPKEQGEKLGEYSEGVPVIIDNGDGSYSIKSAKPVVKADGAGPDAGVGEAGEKPQAAAADDIHSEDHAAQNADVNPPPAQTAADAQGEQGAPADKPASGGGTTSDRAPTEVNVAETPIAPSAHMSESEPEKWVQRNEAKEAAFMEHELPVGSSTHTDVSELARPVSPSLRNATEIIKTVSHQNVAALHKSI